MEDGEGKQGKFYSKTASEIVKVSDSMDIVHLHTETKHVWQVTIWVIAVVGAAIGAVLQGWMSFGASLLFAVIGYRIGLHAVKTIERHHNIH